MVYRLRHRALLYGRNHDRLPPFDGKWLGHHDRLRSPTILRHELGPVVAGFYLDLLLDLQSRQTRLTQGGQFCRGRGKIDPTAATAVAHAVVGRDVGHVGDVGVANDGGVYVRDLTVVAELVVVPIATVITATDITVAVIHTTVVADVASPKATMPAIAT